uniref:Uncharacterized protein n=1 Tax=Arundo donax TaxID=35708 RepID=A0A0A8ZQJ4_ARUDO
MICECDELYSKPYSLVNIQKLRSV